jgi:hypothetical protein
MNTKRKNKILFEQPVYREPKENIIKKILKIKISLNPKIAFWLLFICLISLSIIGFVTSWLQTYEPSHNINFKKINQEKQELLIKKELTKQYFMSYLMKKYPLYESHLSYTLDCIFKAAEVKNLSPLLIIAIIEVESSFDFTAKSSADAYGLMQVHAPSWKKTVKTEKNLFDPCINIDKGTDILKMYLDQNKGDLQAALNNYLGANNSRYNSLILELIGQYYLELDKYYTQNKSNIDKKFIGGLK